ncbi:13262_t:CDS:2, partial [Gigaspora rosea]
DDIDIGLIQHSFKCYDISIATNGSKDDLIFDYDRVENNNNEVNEYIFSNELPFQQYLSSQQRLPLQDLLFQQNGTTKPFDL